MTTLKATREQVPQIVRPSTRPGQPRPVPPGGTGGLTGRDVLRVLRKRKWLIILSVSICFALTFMGTGLWYMFAPLFTAAAYIKVEAPKNRALGGFTALPPTDTMDRILATQAQLVRSQAVLERAVKSPGVRNSYWFKAHQKDPTAKLYEAIGVAPVPQTDLIRVSMTDFTSNDRERAQLADIVNTVATAAVEYIQELANTGYLRENERLNTAYRKEAADLERILADIKQQEKEVGESDASLVIKLRDLTHELQRLELDKKESEAFRKQMESLAPEELSNLPQVRAMVEGDLPLQRLRSEEMNLNMFLERSRDKFGPQHGSTKDAQAGLKYIQTEIRLKATQLTQDAIITLRNSLATDLEMQIARLLEIRKLLAETQASYNDFQKNLAEQERLKVNAKATKDRMDRLQDRQLEVSLLSQDRQVTPAKPAEVPREPSHPRWEVMIPLGIFLGLLIGLGITFTLEFVDTSIKSPSDLARRVDLPLLGMVPHTDDLEEEIEDMRLAFATNPNSLVSEAFRQIRTCLLFSGPVGMRRSLLITSPLPEDGRGTVTMNLAACVARSGRKALVVDANFRQPMVHKLFPQCSDDGLSSALVGQADWRDLVREVEPNLFVMPAGPMPPNPAELLGSDQMRQLVAEMTEQFDQVLFDGAPCLLVTDPAVLSTLVDGVVLVVRAGANTYGIVQKSRDILTRVGAYVLGVVLNGMRVTAGGYLRKNYDAFYAYHEQPQLEAK